jgi:hypothetical protein
MENNVGGCSKTVNSGGCSKRYDTTLAGSGIQPVAAAGVMMGMVLPLSAAIVAVGSPVAVMMTING